MSNNNQILKDKWVGYSAVYSTKELKINGFQVMQSWEDDYMKQLARIATSKGGNVLEIGFGLGISASYIQQAPKLKSHTVIECHPNVVCFASKRFKDRIALGKMVIMNGFWEDVVAKLKDNYFDGILFDSSPLNQETVFFHFTPFFKEAHRLLRGGGIFTYFSDEPKCISSGHMKKLKQAGFSKINYKVCEVSPPKDCRYWPYKTIIAPIIYR